MVRQCINLDAAVPGMRLAACRCRSAQGFALPRLIQQNTAPATLTTAAADPMAGLLATPPWIAPRYFYDALGSCLFAAITELDEYYPARLERAIYRQQAAAIAASVGKDCTLIDLGAGDCGKAALLLHALRPAHYVAVDIAGDFLQASLQRLEGCFPALEITGLVADFSGGLHWPREIGCRRPLFFYPGSSIGNYAPDAARTLLRSLSALCAPTDTGGGLLIGVDLLKPRAQMEAAYDDALGVTACFNLNLLRHLNRIADADFNVRAFRHRALFNEAQQRIEMWLVSRHEQQVRWRGGCRALHAGEAILTECSYKYSPERFEALLHDSGFALVRRWFDESRGFLVCHARSSTG
jgi:dimethylhistidine N-methyltransferase